MRHLTFFPPSRHHTPRQSNGGSGRWVRGDRVPIKRRPATTTVVERHGFLHRVARRVRSIRPPLTADQQLRLLQLALNVKLKREGKPAGAIRLALPDRDRSAQDQVRTGAAPEPSDRGGQPSTTAR